MSEPNKAEAEAAALALAAKEAEELKAKEEAAELATKEAAEKEAAELAEKEAAEKLAAENLAAEKGKDEELSREEFSRIKTAFGADIAASTFEAGGTYESALQLAHDAQAARITELEAQVGEMSATSNGKPAKVTAASAPKSSLFNSTK